MKAAARIVSFLALAATLAIPLLFFYDRLDLAQTKAGLLVAAVAWFLTAPLWMEHRVKD